MQEIHVLAVDDSRDFVSLTADMLYREDDVFSVETATNAVNALSRLRDARANGRASAYDCVVSDYEMPGLDGLELFEATGPRTPRCQCSSSPVRGRNRSPPRRSPAVSPDTSGNRPAPTSTRS